MTVYKQFLCVLCVLCGLPFVSAGERPPPRAPKPAPPKPNDEDMRIGLSPEAIKRAEHFEQLKTYRLAVSGDAKARDSWNGLKACERTTLLSDLVLNPEDTPERKQALKDLAHVSPSDDPKAQGLVALARVAVADGDGSVRDLARKALVVRGDDRTPKILVTALRAEDQLVRANAAAAMKAIGGPRIFEVIIEHWKETWGAGPRANMFVGNMRSYVADYDISGDSYDPVVRSFLTGVVLDAKSLRVEGDIYYITIREVTPFENVNVAKDPAAWNEWVKQERAKLVEDSKKKRALAVSALDGVEEE